MRRSLIIAYAVPVIVAFASEHATAAETPPGWNETSKAWAASFGYGRTFSQSGATPDSPSYSASLERKIGAGFLGLSGAYQTRTTSFERAPAPIGVTGWSGSVYGGRSVGAFDASLSLNYGGEDADFSTLVSLPGGARTVSFAGRNTFTSASATLSRTFGEAWRATPSASLSWSRTQSRVTSAAQPALSVSTSNSGVSGYAGVDVGHDLARGVALSAGAGVAASSNAASVYQLGGLRRTTAPQSFGGEGASAWGEFNLGLSVDAGPAVFSIGGAATAGLPEDTFAVLSGLSVNF